MGSDFNVNGASNGRLEVVFSGVVVQAVSVQHTIDGVAQENNETYSLTLSNRFGFQNYAFENINVTIIDSDRKFSKY